MLPTSNRVIGLAVALFIAVAGQLSAQNPCYDEPFGPGCYWEFSVTPSADSLPVLGSGTAYFSLANTGTNFETFNLTCTATGNASCSYDQGSLSLGSGASQLIGVTFTTTPTGTGSITLTASGISSGYATQGSSGIIDPPLWLVTGAHNGFNRTTTGCAVANCFHAVMAYSTPAYWTLDAPRSVTLVYSSEHVDELHTISVDVGRYAAISPQKISIRLMRSNGSFVTFRNGSTEMFFWPADSTRLAVQFRDSTLATGAYYYTLVLKGIWTSPSTTREVTSPIRLLVLNTRGSPYGAGWSLGGVERIMTSNDSLLSWNGSGRMQFWRRISCGASSCSYAAPSGEFAQLQRLGSPTQPLNLTYERTEVDGRKLTFNFLGLLQYVDDVFGNRVRFVWHNNTDVLDSIIDPAGKAIVFGYDGSNRLDWIRDVPGNRTTQITVDGSNNLTQIIDAAGDTTFKNIAYDTFHRLTARTDRRGGQWLYTYDTHGKLATDSTPAVTADSVLQRLGNRYRSPESAILVDSASGLGSSGSPATLEPDSAGVGTIKPPIGSTRKIRVGAFGSLVEVLAPATEFARYLRNTNGQIYDAIDSSGHKTFAWSGPRLTSQYDVVTGLGVWFEWNTTTNRLTRQYGSGTVDTRYFYDASGYRLDSVKTISEPATRFTYDSRGRVLTATDPRGHTTTTWYGGNTWLNVDSSKIGTRRLWYTYDATAGRPSITREPGGRIDSTFYDVLNRVTRTGGPLGYKVTYAYGDSLNLTSVIDGNSHEWRVNPNAIGWDTLSINPLNDTIRTEYNKAGTAWRLRNARGQLTRFLYDSLGRLTSRFLSDGSVTNFAYGPTRVYSANPAGSDTVRWSGDSVFEIAVRGGVPYRVRTVYDTTRKFSLAVWRSSAADSNYVRFVMDSAGRVRTITLLYPSGGTDTLSHTTDGSVASIKAHGAWTFSRSFRPGHDVARAAYSLGGLQSAFGGDFVQDTVGQLREQVKSGGAEFERFTYDLRGRLTRFQKHSASPACPLTDTLSEFGSLCAYSSGIQVQDSFSYDPVGNRTDRNAVVDAANRLRRFDGDSMLYDRDGNLTRRYRISDSTLFNQLLFWNSINQLDSVRTRRGATTQTVRFAYDAMGRRVRKSAGPDTVWYVYSGPRVIAEYNAAGTQLRRYSYLPGMDNPHSVYQSGAYHFYATDSRGNVRAVVNPSGTTIEAEYRYKPHGDTLSTSGTLANSVRYAGRELDSETGYYYNRARYYDPAAGRFVSEDAGDLTPVNRYTYAGNDPVNGRDPEGRWCVPAGPQEMQGPPVGRSQAVEGWHCEDLTNAEWAWLSGGGRGDPPGWLNYDPSFFDDPLFINGGRGILGEGGFGSARLDLAVRDEWAWITVSRPGLKGCPETPTKLALPGLGGNWPPQATGQGTPVVAVLYLQSRHEFFDPNFGVIWGALYTGTMHVTFQFSKRVLRTYQVTGIAGCAAGGGEFIGHAAGP